jgi:hypothetical protein
LPLQAILSLANHGNTILLLLHALRRTKRLFPISNNKNKLSQTTKRGYLTNGRRLEA